MVNGKWLIVNGKWLMENSKWVLKNIVRSKMPATENPALKGRNINNRG